MLELRAHTNAVKAAIVAAVAPVKVGMGEAPPGAGWVNNSTSFVMYVTLTPIAGGGYSGTLGDPRLMQQRLYQASCNGISVEQSEWLADEVSGILDTLTVSGKRVCFVDPENSPGTFRDPDTDPPIFVTPFIFRLTTT